MLKGFKKFISQGNVIDLAVAVIIGNAFKPIVDKVTETIMGIIGQLIGSPNFDSVGKFSLLSNPQGDADSSTPARSSLRSSTSCSSPRRSTSASSCR